MTCKDLLSNSQYVEDDLYMETLLAQSNVLRKLERSGVIPQARDPNPHDPHKDLESYDQWWKNHPESAGEFQLAIRQRNQVLRQIYLGYQLGKSG